MEPGLDSPNKQKGDTSILDREPKTVMVSLTDLWILQKAIKYNTFMFDPRNNRPMWPSKVVQLPSGPQSFHTSWRLRNKVNSLILRFVQEEVENKRLLLPLDYDEAWSIDAVLSVESYSDARLLLVQVMQVLWEYEYGVDLKTGVINNETTGPDGKFNVNDLIEYVSTKNGEEAKGFYGIDSPPDHEEEPPMTTA